MYDILEVYDALRDAACQAFSSPEARDTGGTGFMCWWAAFLFLLHNVKDERSSRINSLLADQTFVLKIK